MAVLGPLEVTVDGAPVQLAGDRLRAALCRLAGRWSGDWAERTR
ncbi:MAG TPA: hypothetical protein VHF06_02940 [Pseudonocardiaceae bacterium]|nr:hypothetical protein [Pseudonocardiaceae bacterium]